MLFEVCYRAEYNTFNRIYKLKEVYKELFEVPGQDQWNDDVEERIRKRLYDLYEKQGYLDIEIIINFHTKKQVHNIQVY